MAINDIPLKVRFKAIDRMSKTIAKVKGKFPELTKAVKRANRTFKVLQKSTAKLRKNLSKLGNGMKSVGSKLTVGLTAPIAALGISSIATATDFQKAMNVVEAKAKQGNTSIKDLREQAKLLGSTTQFSATQASEAMGFLAQAGFDTDEIFKAIPGTLDLAAASGAGLAETADIASNIMGGFNIKAEEMGRVSDVLALTTARTNVDLIQLGETMKFAAPVAEEFGLSLEETAAAAGLLGNVGIQGSNAGTALKRALLGLAAPASKARKLISALGVEVEGEGGKLRSLTDIMGDLGNAFADKKLSQAQKLTVLNELFGKIGIAGAAKLTQFAKSGDLEKLTSDLLNSEGAAAKMRKTMVKGLPGAINSVKSSFEGFQLALTEGAFGEFVEDLLNGLAGLFRWLTKLNPTVLKWGIIIAGVAAAAGPLLVALGVLVTMLPGLVSGFAFIAANSTLIISFFTGVIAPIAGVALAVGLLVTAGVMLFNQWDNIKKLFSDFWDEPLKTGGQFFDFVMDGAKNLANFFGGGFKLSTDTNENGLTEEEQAIADRAFKPRGAPLTKGDASIEGAAKPNSEFIDRTNNARVEVTVRAPAGTAIVGDSEGGVLDLNMGAVGN